MQSNRALTPPSSDDSQKDSETIRFDLKPASYYQDILELDEVIEHLKRCSIFRCGSRSNSDPWNQPDKPAEAKLGVTAVLDPEKKVHLPGQTPKLNEAKQVEEIKPAIKSDGEQKRAGPQEDQKKQPEKKAEVKPFPTAVMSIPVVQLPGIFGIDLTASIRLGGLVGQFFPPRPIPSAIFVHEPGTFFTGQGAPFLKGGWVIPVITPMQSRPIPGYLNHSHFRRRRRRNNNQSVPTASQAPSLTYSPGNK